MSNWDEGVRRPVAPQVARAALCIAVGSTYAYFRLADGNLLISGLVGCATALIVGLVSRARLNDATAGRSTKPMAVVSPLSGFLAIVGLGFVAAALGTQQWALIGAGAPFLALAVALTSVRSLLPRR